MKKTSIFTIFIAMSLQQVPSLSHANELELKDMPIEILNIILDYTDPDSAVKFSYTAKKHLPLVNPIFQKRMTQFIDALHKTDPYLKFNKSDEELKALSAREILKFVNRSQGDHPNLHSSILLEFYFKQRILDQSTHHLLKFFDPNKIATQMMNSADFLHATLIFNLTGITNKILMLNPKLIEEKGLFGENALHSAAVGGNLKLVQRLLKEHPHFITELDDPGRTVIHYASMGGNLDVMKLLIEKKPDLATKTSRFFGTALHAAAKYGRTNAVRYLLERNPKLAQVKDRFGKTALHVAARNGYYETVRLFLEHDPILANLNDKRNSNILHQASYSGHFPLVKWIANRFPQMLCQINTLGQSPLHASVEEVDRNFPIRAYPRSYPQFRLQTVQLLLELTPSSIAKIKSQTPPENILNASICLFENPHISKLVFEKYPELAEEIRSRGGNALYFAAEENNVDLFRQIHDRYPFLVDREYHNDGEAGEKILHATGSLEIIQFLLEKYPHLALQKNGFNKNGLHKVVGYQDPDLTQFILERFPQLAHEADLNGNTPFHTLFLSDYPENFDFIKVAYLFLDRHPELTLIRNSAGQTVFDLASQSSRIDIQKSSLIQDIQNAQTRQSQADNQTHNQATMDEFHNPSTEKLE